MIPAVYLEPAAARRIALIGESHRRLLGRALAAEDTVAALWEAGPAIVAHGTEDDPRFFFGNRAALARFAMSAEQFVGMPSRLSAEAPLREERAELLARVTRDGFITNYCGIRIAASGERFRIIQAVVWNLMDEGDAVQGQAAAFDRWEPV